MRFADLKVFLMAVLRLNDGKHFIAGSTNQKKKDKVYGSISAQENQDELVISQDECKVIKKIFEPLYSNHLQFKGKVMQE